jgi:hypothetical protein
MLLLVCGIASPARSDEPRQLTFERDIRPVFRTHCFDCHGAESELKGGLDLRLVRLMQQGGESGPALVPGRPEESYLLQRVRNQDMPPGDKKLSPEEIQLLQQWIEQGAATVRPEPEQIGKGLQITPEDRAYWAYQPVRRPAVPVYADERIRTPIDALLQQAMPAGLTFSPDADKRTLLFRACFDLTGLPPAPELTEAFLADDSPQAYERLLDRLLASPHYGERWARHWLDVAGYADSEGSTVADAERPWAWRYRDYVIQSFNDDKPFDQFLMEQLAGDELAGPIQGDLTPRQVELFTATGFLRMAADGTGSGGDSPEARNQTIADTLKIVGSSLLGMSVACAQCHDHRYDPLPQTDYFALRAVFEPALDWQAWKTPAQRQISLYTAADRQQAADLEAQAQQVAQEKNQKQTEYLAAALDQELQKYEELLRVALRAALDKPEAERTDEQKELLKNHPSVNISPGVLYQYNQSAADDLKKYDERMNQIRAQKPEEQFIRALLEPAGHLPETKRFHRGDHRQPLESVGPGVPQILCPENQPVALAVDDGQLPSSGRRLALARWLVSPANPISARVLVNRVWLHHFGRAIVDTPAEFGKLGATPTHPQLLDWLADEWPRQGWSLKALHKTIMLSTAYRQSSQRDAARQAIDADNQFYWRKPILRLDAELVRDRMLASSGQLDPTLFGRPLAIKEDDAGQTIVDGAQRRRSLYIQVRRSRPLAMLQSFDAPVMETNCDRRTSSTVATQSLMLLNGEFTLEQAAQLAARAEREAPGSLDPQLWAELPEPSGGEGQAALLPQAARAWQLAYGRPPQREEMELVASYLAQQMALYAGGGATLRENTTAPRQALINVCHVLLCSNEFLYIQ